MSIAIIDKVLPMCPISFSRGTSLQWTIHTIRDTDQEWGSHQNDEMTLNCTTDNWPVWPVATEKPPSTQYLFGTNGD